MPTIRSGDITALNLWGREFDPAPDSNVTYRLSTFTNESGMTGNGRLHTTQRRRPAGFESLPISVNSERGDAEYIANEQANPSGGTCWMELASGVTYVFEGAVPEGDADPNTGDGQLELTIRAERGEKL